MTNVFCILISILKYKIHDKSISNTKYKILFPNVFQIKYKIHAKYFKYVFQIHFEYFVFEYEIHFLKLCICISDTCRKYFIFCICQEKLKIQIFEKLNQYTCTITLLIIELLMT